MRFVFAALLSILVSSFAWLTTSVLSLPWQNMPLAGMLELAFSELAVALRYYLIPASILLVGWGAPRGGIRLHEALIIPPLWALLVLFWAGPLQTAWGLAGHFPWWALGQYWRPTLPAMLLLGLAFLTGSKPRTRR